MLGRSLACLSVIAALAGPARADTAPHGEPGAPVTLYLNGSGVELSAGDDESRTNFASLLHARGLGSLTVPAYQGSASAWREYVDCVEEQLAAFRIDVVDERPADGDYIMAAVGGSPSMLGYGRTVSGVAGYNGGVNRSSVIFIFERAMNGDPSATCDTTLQELGHALGLDHTYEPGDAMSYLHSHGRKSFKDVEARCGEQEARTCASGDETQNSYRQLSHAVGLREDESRRTEPTLEPPPVPTDPINPRQTDTEAPTLEIVTPEAGESVDGEQFVQIVLWAEDPSGISKVELGWTSSRGSSVFTLGAIPAGIPVWGINEGNVYVFVVRSGEGAREFAVRVTDGAGNQTVSEHRNITVTGLERS